jgi:4-oxalmesaconate hydratase
MIIDVHGHYTTAPAEHEGWRRAQVDATRSGGPTPGLPSFGDDEIRETVLTGQLRVQDARGVDVTLFSPRAAGMGHHLAPVDANAVWSQVANDLVARVVDLFPTRFVGVGQLPQAPGAPLDAAVREVRRCVEELGFVGCNVNPDPSGGVWDGPPITDRSWYPLWETLVELDVPAMIHVSSSSRDAVHATGAHYLNGDTTAFMQLVEGDLFRDFPTLRLVFPHGGGAVPYHWGRFRGLAAQFGHPSLTEHVLDNVFFDTCVYHQAGVDLLTSVIPARNVLFASETIGAVSGVDPETGHDFDDTRRYVEAAPVLDAAARSLVLGGNALDVYGRLADQLGRQGVTGASANVVQTPVGAGRSAA